jgi:hypothetical protein
MPQRDFSAVGIFSRVFNGQDGLSTAPKLHGYYTVRKRRL